MAGPARPGPTHGTATGTQAYANGGCPASPRAHCPDRLRHWRSRPERRQGNRPYPPPPRLDHVGQVDVIARLAATDPDHVIGRVLTGDRVQRCRSRRSGGSALPRSAPLSRAAARRGAPASAVVEAACRHWPLMAGAGGAGRAPLSRSRGASGSAGEVSILDRPPAPTTTRGQSRQASPEVSARAPRRDPDCPRRLMEGAGARPHWVVAVRREREGSRPLISVAPLELA